MKPIPLAGRPLADFSHPLDPGDTDDYSLAIHDKVGWCLTYDDSSNAPPNNPGFAFGELQYPAGCFVDFSNSTGGLVRVDTTLFGDITKLSELDELLEKLRDKLKDIVAVCKFCPPGPRAKLLRGDPGPQRRDSPRRRSRSIGRAERAATRSPRRPRLRTRLRPHRRTRRHRRCYSTPAARPGTRSRS